MDSILSSRMSTGQLKAIYDQYIKVKHRFFRFPVLYYVFGTFWYLVPYNLFFLKFNIGRWGTVALKLNQVLLAFLTSLFSD